MEKGKTFHSSGPLFSLFQCFLAVAFGGVSADVEVQKQAKQGHDKGAKKSGKVGRVVLASEYLHKDGLNIDNAHR